MSKGRADQRVWRTGSPLHKENCPKKNPGQGEKHTGRVATCQGKLIVFKVREISMNFEICQGKIEFRKMSGKTDL